MYTQAQLEKFTAGIDAIPARRTFGARIDKLRFNDIGFCSRGELARVFRGTSVDHLRAAFERDIARYISPEESAVRMTKAR